MDHWLQYIPGKNTNKFLLQFIGCYRVKPEEGKFFIIDIHDKKKHEFKLGNYNLAKEKGVFSLK